LGKKEGENCVWAIKGCVSSGFVIFVFYMVGLKHFVRVFLVVSPRKLWEGVLWRVVIKGKKEEGRSGTNGRFKSARAAHSMRFWW